MNINGKHYRTIWLKEGDESVVQIIDQRHLPHRFIIEDLRTVDEIAVAIKDMLVRGAGLIGATAAYGMYIAARHIAQTTPDDETFTAQLTPAAEQLMATRPTAVNLEWAVKRQLQSISTVSGAEAKVKRALEVAQQIADEDADACKRIGEHGLQLIEEISQSKEGETVNILTHCNAGWLAFVDYGSATAPVYAAHDKGIKVHVWVDETRPRNQGARLTAWELGQHGVPHTIIADNVGGHLMQHGMVDLVITGADRVTYTGDAANKIGTYLKALAAKDNNIPFYVALPSSTFDWKKGHGLRDIPIEERGSEEVHIMSGVDEHDVVREIRITPQGSPAANYGFDVTPARLITGLITERGIALASETSVLDLFPEKRLEVTSTVTGD
jgi:methylthioribose-1-phosphate isomerase